MYTGQVDVISSKATWISKAVELVDEDTGTTTDLTTITPLDIVVTISGTSERSYCCDYGETAPALVTASIANGKVTVPGPGFQWRFEVADLSGLTAGTYRLDVKITMGGIVTDLIDGTIAVIEGN